MVVEEHDESFFVHGECGAPVVDELGRARKRERDFFDRREERLSFLRRRHDRVRAASHHDAPKTFLIAASRRANASIFFASPRATSCTGCSRSRSIVNDARGTKQPPQSEQRRSAIDDATVSEVSGCVQRGHFPSRSPGAFTRCESGAVSFTMATSSPSNQSTQSPRHVGHVSTVDPESSRGSITTLHVGHESGVSR